MFAYLIHTILEYPLREIYFKGPKLHGIGFWEGSHNSTICARLTSTNERTWLTNPEQCSEIVQNNYNSYKTLIFSLLMLYIYLHIIYNIPMIIFYSMTAVKYLKHQYTRTEQKQLEA